MIRAQIQPGLWLDSRRAVFFEALGVLAVADVHWGYAASHRAAGNLLPLWGDEAIERTLNALIADYTPREMIWVGDSLHAVSGRAAAEAFLKNATLPIAVLPGNHDRKWCPNPAAHAVRASYLFHHGDVAHQAGDGNLIEVIGHHHPSFNWDDGAGSRIKLPALVQGPRRLILPAFSPWAGGVPWNDALRDDEHLWVISAKRVFAVTPAMLRR